MEKLTALDEKAPEGTEQSTGEHREELRLCQHNAEKWVANWSWALRNEQEFVEHYVRGVWPK